MMGKFNETTSSSYRGSSYRGSSYRGSSYRGSSYRGSNFRGGSYRGAPHPRGGGFSSSRGGYVEARHERLDPRLDARYHLKNQAARNNSNNNNKPHIIDARSLLRNNDYNRETSPPRKPRYNGSGRDRSNEYPRNENVRDSSGSYRRGLGTRRGSVGSATHHSYKQVDGYSSRGRFDSSTSRGDRENGRARERERDRGRDRSEAKEIRVTVPGLKKSRSYSSEKASSQRDSSRQINSSSRDHYVTRSDKKTTITLNNSKFNSSHEGSFATKRARDRSNSPDFKPSKDRGEKSNSNMKFEPIKIQILNSNYVPPTDNSNAKSEDSMDYESSSSENDTTSNKYPGFNQAQQAKQSQAEALSAGPQSASSSSSSMLSGLTPVAAALLQNSHNLGPLNSFHSSYKPPSLAVNNFNPGSSMYNNSYDCMWNPNPNNFYSNNKSTAPAADSSKEPEKPQPTVTAKSSKEGYKLLVSNLHPKVSEDDVLELFSDIGPIKRARFIDKGLAEVVYVRIEHAKEAIDKYDLKELDGRQMVIGFADKSLLSSSTEQQQAPRSLHPAYNSHIPHTQSPIPSGSMYPGAVGSPYLNHSKTIDNSAAAYYGASNKSSQEPIASTLSERFKTKEQSSVKVPESKHIDKSQSINHVDSNIIHQVLFKKAPPTNGAPVTFTVKL